MIDAQKRTTREMRAALTAAFVFGKYRLKPDGIFRSPLKNAPELQMDPIRKLLDWGWLEPSGLDGVEITLAGREAERALYAKYRGK